MRVEDPFSEVFSVDFVAELGEDSSEDTLLFILWGNRCERLA